MVFVLIKLNSILILTSSNEFNSSDGILSTLTALLFLKIFSILSNYLNIQPPIANATGQSFYLIQFLYVFCPSVCSFFYAQQWLTASLIFIHSIFEFQKYYLLFSCIFSYIFEYSHTFPSAFAILICLLLVYFIYTIFLSLFFIFLSFVYSQNLNISPVIPIAFDFLDFRFLYILS